MPFQRLRRALFAVACASSLALAACGGGGDKVVSQFKPSRVVAFGDAFSDAGMVGGARYLDSSGSNWTQLIANQYGLSLVSTSSGGTSYATGNARVATRPDAAGSAVTLPVTDQVTAFLAAGGPASGDLVIVSGGISDLIVEARTPGTAIANSETAGTALAAEVVRLVNAGAKHVMVVGPYNLGRSPYATATGQGALLTSMTTAFNTKLKIALANYGNQVLYVDAELYFNLATGSPSAYGFTDVSSLLCTAVDAGPGIGIGAGEVNASLCNTAALSGAPPGTTMFADKVYFTTAANSTFATYAYTQFRERF